MTLNKSLYILGLFSHPQNGTILSYLPQKDFVRGKICFEAHMWIIKYHININRNSYYYSYILCHIQIPNYLSKTLAKVVIDLVQIKHMRNNLGIYALCVTVMWECMCTEGKGTVWYRDENINYPKRSNNYGPMNIFSILFF